ncbi:glycerophosphoryl diester phosphodiesterase membrane domain-containing protein [Sphingomonas sp.]|uniref:glycerophosphoryl diester phosphodiesterase membrane domain-containing protein n=1 Tax=Sphingomonas sp. TaxID=28214 RepID=UPI002ED8AF84
MVSMGTVWDRTAEFLSDNLGIVLPVALGAIFVPAAISGSLSGLQQGAAPGLGAVLGLASLLLAIVTFWGQLAITALALDPAIGRAAMRVATQRLPAALLVTIALFLALFLLVIPVGIIMALSGADLSVAATGAMPRIPPAAGLWVLLYFLVLLPVLFWLTARLVVILPVITGEKAMFGAIPRSWSLTRGAALRIVGVLILYGIVASVAYLAATTAFGAIITLIAGRGEDGLSLATVLTVIVGGAVSTAFTVLGTAFTAKLYLALRAAREAAPA